METFLGIVFSGLAYLALAVFAARRYVILLGEPAWRPPPPGGARLLTISERGVRLSTRFVAFSEIAEVSHSQRVVRNDGWAMRSTVHHVQNGILFRLHSGESIDVETVMVSVKTPPEATSNPGVLVLPPDSETNHQLVTLRARIAEAHAHSPQSPASRPSAAPPELSRNGRSAEEWLLALSGGASRYRAIRIPNDALWRLLEDPGVLPSARVGAALALRASLNDEGRTRLRVASEGAAAPALRVAIAKVAEESSDDELIDALSQIED